MRPYVRPLVVTFSALGLACLFSYAAILLTDAPVRPIDSQTDGLSPEAKAAMAFFDAKLAAASSDPAKLRALANFHLLGIGTEKDEAKAAQLHKLGAEKGDAFCQSLYGQDLLLGVGLRKDVPTALTWLLRAAAQKQPDAEYALHRLYSEGTDVKADEDAARRWLLRAAEHGHHDARADLAEEILKTKDRKRAKSVLTWLRPGALAGHARSCHMMGFVHSVGFGVKADPVEAMAWRLVLLNIDDEVDPSSWKIDYNGLGEEGQAQAEARAQELSGQRAYASPFAPDPAVLAAEQQDFAETKRQAQNGDMRAQFHLAMLYDFGRGTAKDEAEAARWCRKAAEQGLAEAQFTLGQTLRLGEAVVPDLKEAFAWYMKSALQGNPDAEHAVSVCYLQGDGVKANEAEARIWRQKAAEHGEPRSQCNLGNEYYGEKPDPANDAIAARWYRKAAEQLHPKGGLSFGLCHLTGRGVKPDRIEGLAWIFSSADGLAPDQKEFLIRLVDDFSEEEVVKAGVRSREIIKECRAKLAAAEAKESK